MKGVFMQRILLALVLVFIFSASVFAQGAALPVPIDFAPLIQFDEKFFDDMRQWFTDTLKEQWVLLLSLFFVWITFAYTVGVLEGKMDRIKLSADVRRQVERQIMVEDQRAKLMARQRVPERSRDVAMVESSYRSREMQNIVLNDNESFAQINGDYYVRSESYDVVSYKTLEQWRAARDSELDEPLAFDNEDYGRVYESIVDRDYTGRVSDEYREISMPRYDLPPEGLSDERLDSIPYEEDADYDLADEHSLDSMHDRVKAEVAREHGYKSWAAFNYSWLDKRGQLSYGFEDWDDFDREELTRARRERSAITDRASTYW
jgi:hypothetical protein